MEEPGIDRHDWEAEWEALEPLVRESPSEALPELDDLVGRIMLARGVPLAECAGEDLAEHETTREFAEARRVASLVDEGGDVDPGDVAHAVNTYRSLFEQLVAFGPDPGLPS